VDEPAEYGRRLAAITIGAPQRLDGPIELAEYDPRWPRTFREAAATIAAVLGGRVRRIEHVGSTSVAGLASKPIVDIVVEVAEAADEADYVPALEAAGYALRIREPAWFEHRLLVRADPAVNLHVFSAGCAETERMVGLGSGAAPPIATATRAPSASLRRAPGPTCSSTPTPRAR